MRLIGLAVATALMTLPHGAWSRCMPSSGPLTEAELRSADLIAYGRIIYVEPAPHAPHERFADLLVQARWKGDSLKKIRIWSPDSVHGPRFVLGGEFLVFAHRVGDRYEASPCLPSCSGLACVPPLKLLGDPIERFDTVEPGGPDDPS